MDQNESMSQDRFSAILENQRAIMVNQATILHNQNKIMRGLEQLFTYFPASQSSFPAKTVVPVPLSATPIQSFLSGENSRGEQPPPPAAQQVPAVQPPPVSTPRAGGTTPINTPTRPQAPLNSATPALVPPPIKTLPSSGASSPGSENDNEPSGGDSGGNTAPPYISQDDLTQIKCKSCSIGNFAVQLMRHIFDQTELDNRNCTGTRGKEPVDPDRLRFVKETVFEVYAIASDDKVNTWRHCVRAIDEYLRRPKRMMKGELSKSVF